MTLVITEKLSVINTSTYLDHIRSSDEEIGGVLDHEGPVSKGRGVYSTTCNEVVDVIVNED
ncbi:hypothetical protein DPMN_132498 [Dreissena polymorpha]|uniref:Uncharacterized protein n=1 Tax=Dreissena polymorpha TaxID=45954 RepID=A0A9D4J8Y7_DREPO|nr:hypothetical protein DPMN_132498 [Dreissena polymorpha]